MILPPTGERFDGYRSIFPAGRATSVHGEETGRSRRAALHLAGTVEGPYLRRGAKRGHALRFGLPSVRSGDRTDRRGRVDRTPDGDRAPADEALPRDGGHLAGERDQVQRVL